ncbi:MAG: hypothetical protein WBS24_11650 [Terriglobales bacterium]
MEAWIASLVALLLTGSTIALIQWHRQQPISLRGAVLSADSDPRKQLPIPGVEVSAGEFGISTSTSNSDGFFILKLRKPIRQGHAITLRFSNSQYRPLQLNDVVSNKLYVVHLVPLSTHPAIQNQPRVRIANVRVRYTSQTMTEVNVGSSVKTFEIVNKGNVPCNGHHPCSPDGKWKAVAGSSSLDAGPGNEFRDGRASCIAGPCPFTKIDSDRLSQGGQILTVSARDWSDTATFLLEAEVFRPMASQIEHWSYPVIFGEGLSFTLPSDAESVSMEADLDGQTIIFPLGPALFLSWATCDVEVNPDRGRIYRCALKSGYRFQ